jgi:3-oxoacyl-[acyl-carrier-protein] synthase-3
LNQVSKNAGEKVVNSRPVRIIGTGHAVPSQELTSQELDSRLNHPAGYIERYSGVRKRHVTDRSENAAILGARAGALALKSANIKSSEIDCLISASASMDQGMPCNAALMHYEMGLSDTAVPAFDVNASCLGFLAAIDTVSWAIAAGRYKRVLIIAADVASCGLNWDDIESSAIFGDGAAAAVIGLSDDESGSRILSTNLQTRSCGVDLCKIPGGGTRFHPNRIDEPYLPLAAFKMDGKAVFKLAAEHVPGFIDNLLVEAGTTRDEIDWVVPHQASHLALKHLTKRLGLRREKVVNIFAEYGNQVAASLPTALDMAIRDGRIRRGHRVLLIGAGAGFSMGGAVLDY